MDSDIYKHFNNNNMIIFIEILQIELSYNYFILTNLN